MSDLIESMRRHVASYKTLTLHRQQCLDMCDEIEKLNRFVRDIRDAWQSYCDNPPLRPGHEDPRGFEDHRIFYEISDVLDGTCCRPALEDNPCIDPEREAALDKLAKLDADLIGDECACPDGAEDKCIDILCPRK